MAVLDFSYQPVDRNVFEIGAGYFEK